MSFGVSVDKLITFGWCYMISVWVTSFGDRPAAASLSLALFEIKGFDGVKLCWVISIVSLILLIAKSFIVSAHISFDRKLLMQLFCVGDWVQVQGGHNHFASFVSIMIHITRNFLKKCKKTKTHFHSRLAIAPPGDSVLPSPAPLQYIIKTAWISLHALNIYWSG